MYAYNKEPVIWTTQPRFGDFGLHWRKSNGGAINGKLFNYFMLDYKTCMTLALCEIIIGYDAYFELSTVIFMLKNNFFNLVIYGIAVWSL